MEKAKSNAKAIKLNKKTTKIILIVAVVAVLAVGIFFLVKNLPQGTGNINPESNASSQAPVKDPQLNAILGSTDSSEPSDAATTIDPSNTVDSTGLT